MTTFEVRGVRAKAYKSNNSSALTHLVEVDADGYAVKVACPRVKVEHIFDEAAVHMAEKGHEAAALIPTCPICLKAWQKMQAK